MKKISRRRFLRNGLLAGLGLGLLDAAWLEGFFVELKRHDLRPAGQEAELRILQISDLHLKSLGWKHQRLLRSIRRAQPDLIAITGDAIDAADQLELLDRFLGQLPMDTPVVAILGNWEYWGEVDLEALSDTYARHGGQLLINQHRQYTFSGRKVGITGIDDFVGGSADYATAIRDYQAVDFHLVLTHCPVHCDWIERERGPERIDLILAGHTHGGQITLLGYAPYCPPGSGTYVRGWYRERGLPLYVSKGVGTSVFPLRFGSRAEVGLFRV
ncbi:MAG: metallophosphoesterase [Bacteroidota bacterium]